MGKCLVVRVRRGEGVGRSRKVEDGGLVVGVAVMMTQAGRHRRCEMGHVEDEA